VILRGTLSRAALTVTVALTAALAAGCRTETIWAGVEVQDDGRIRLVAEAPRCGCLTVTNATDLPVKLQSLRGLQTLGQATLQPRHRATYRFDSAGTYEGAAYLIEVTTPEGERLDAHAALHVDERPAWVFCEEAPCEYGALMMDLADIGR
jgi:hypothetical protein